MEDLHSGDELARSWQLLVAVLRVPVPTCGHPRSPACHQPISNDRDGATLAVRVTDKQDWDHRRSCRKIWNYECAPQHEGHLPCIMARMLSIFPVFQLVCVLPASQKRRKRKKNPCEILWCGIITGSVFWKSWLCVAVFQNDGKSEGRLFHLQWELPKEGMHQSWCHWHRSDLGVPCWAF